MIRPSVRGFEKIIRCLIYIFLGASFSQGAGVEHVKLSPASEMMRAELFIWVPETVVKAVIIFCPGHNGVGRSFVENAQWQAFARKHDLALCGLSFASDYDLTRQGKGYSHVERGSGKLLLDALDGVFKGGKLPLFLYGYPLMENTVVKESERNGTKLSGIARSFGFPFRPWLR